MENRKTYTRVRGVSNVARLSIDVCGINIFGLFRKAIGRLGKWAVTPESRYFSSFVVGCLWAIRRAIRRVNNVPV